MTTETTTLRDRDARPLTGKRGGTFRVNLAVDTDSTDPALAAHTVSFGYEYATQAKLFNHRDMPGDPGLQLVPELAADFPTISPDGRTYTVKIRSGADAYRFNTGEAVTAAHIAEALQRVLNPRMGSPGRRFIDCVMGADDVLDERAPTASGVRVLAEDTLEIELTEPTPDFLTRLSMPFFAPVPVGFPVVPGGIDTPPSAGPYFIASRTRDESIQLERNPHYRHGRPAWVDRISYRVGFTPEDSLDLVERGEADFLGDGIPPDHEARLGSEYGVNSRQFLVTTAIQLDYIALNTMRPLFSDVRVRRAVNFAVDRPASVQLRGEHSGVTADHILPPRMPGYRDERIYPLDGPDFARARAELPPDFQGGHAVYYGRDNLAAPKIALNLRDCLEQIGIDVEIRMFPDAVLHKRAGMRGEPFDCLLTGWFAEYPDPFVFFNQLLHGKAIKPSDGVNFAYFDDPDYNAKMDFAARLTGPERFEAYGLLDLEMTRDAAPWVPCNSRTGRDFVSGRVQNAFHHSIYGLDFAALWLDDGDPR
jgi:peptide/nickel transport system substrate-binding protein